MVSPLTKTYLSASETPKLAGAGVTPSDKYPPLIFPSAISLAPKLSEDTVLCIDSCGHSLKDSDIIKEKLGFYTE